MVGLGENVDTSRQPQESQQRQKGDKETIDPEDLKPIDETEYGPKFSLSEDPLDTTFCNNFRGVLLKRFNSYKRSKKRVCVEMLLPSAFMIFGVWLSSIDFNYRSDPRILSPSLYPLKQKLYMNEFVYDQADSNQ